MASLKITCGFIPIRGEQYFRPSAWRKGRNLTEAGHVRLIIETPDAVKGSVVTSKCLPQTCVNANEYIIKIQLNVDRTIREATCTCKAGILGHCKHTAATVISVNYESSNSKTSKPQKWVIPSTKKSYRKGERLENMFPKTKRLDLPRPRELSVVLDYFPDLDCPLLSAVRASKQTAIRIVVRELLEQMTVRVCEDAERQMITNLLNQAEKSSSKMYATGCPNISKELSEF